MNRDLNDFGSIFYRSKIDLNTPNIARMYDYYLGGKNNFDSDREAAEQVIARVPAMCKAARRNCHFLSRAVRFLAGECGIRQFIDLGTGFPAQESVHKVAQEIAPEARVICVDNDPVVLTHARALGVPNDNVTVLAADIREPQTILGSSDVRELIDFSEPVAVLALAVLCCITDKEDPYRIVDAFREVIPAGSYIAITHIESTEQTRAAARVYDTANAPIVPRSRSELMRFFGGLDLVEPGIVSLSEWSPGFAIPNPRLPFLCGIGRKP